MTAAIPVATSLLEISPPVGHVLRLRVEHAISLLRALHCFLHLRLQAARLPRRELVGTVEIRESLHALQISVGGGISSLLAKTSP